MEKEPHDFWYITWVAWRKGLLSKVLPNTRDAAALPFDEFSKGAEVTHPAMDTFFRHFEHQPLEFLVCHDIYSDEKPYFILTNKRLVVRTRDDPTYQVVPLSEVKEFSCFGLWENTLEFGFKDGKRQEFRKIGIVPSDNVLGWAIRKAQKEKAWDYLKKQLSKPRAIHESETIKPADNIAAGNASEKHKAEPPSLFTRLLRDSLYIFAGAGGFQLYENLSNAAFHDGFTGDLPAWLATAAGTTILLYLATRLPGSFLDYGSGKDDANDKRPD